MSFGTRLEMRQSQQLVMTPQLQQAIKLLQMSNLELMDYVAQEVEQNPLLEENDSVLDFDSKRAANDSEFTQGDENTKIQHQEDSGLTTVELKEDYTESANQAMDTGMENVYADESFADQQNEAAAKEAENWQMVGAGGSSKFEAADEGFETRLAAQTTLREHLLAQLTLTDLGRVERLIAAALIEMIDAAGYLQIDLEKMAERLGTGLETVQTALDALQQMEPTGIAARDLKECLALQLIEKGRYDPAMECFLAHLEQVSKGLTPKLAKLCQVDQEDLRDMLREIRLLDPKPGARFDYVNPQTLIPDVYVRPNRMGGWYVELNSHTMPKLLLNTRYAAEVQGQQQGNETVKTYLAECHQNANWLLKSIDQRARTILKVATEIVRQQDGFFAFGVHELRPLNLKTIADAIEMHESTVSRVTSNKYLSTDRGVFEMKFFFTAAISATEGDEVYAAEAIRHRIKTLIETETVKTVLSDEKIVQLLRHSGIDIARRTVAKYREAMHIPSSVQRRRQMAAMG